MNHFVRIVMENQEEQHALNESVFPEQNLYETEQGASVIEIPLSRQLTESESDEYAEKLANMLFAEGYEDFDIEISSDEAEVPIEETYDGNDFFEEYGVLGYIDDTAEGEDLDLDEAKGDIRKALAAAGLAGALAIGGGAALDATSVKKSPLGKELRAAAQAGDEVAAYHYKNLDFYMQEDPRTLINLKIAYVDDSERDDVQAYLARKAGINEAKYRGRKVKLNKPMRGDVKKFKVYVKDPKTKNVKKVNFGDPDMRIKKSNPKRRRSFRARHNCDNPGPKTKARYWSCRKW